MYYQTRIHINDIVCRECGSGDQSAKWINGDELKEAQLCQGCHGWLRLAKIINDKDIPWHRAIIIGGRYFVAYSLGVHQDGDKSSLGFGGKVFCIRHLTNGQEITTDNLSYGGTIPPHLRDRLPDNAQCDFDFDEYFGPGR